MSENAKYVQKLDAVRGEINKVIKGKSEVVSDVLAAVVAGGHVLMEDIPGVGKTTLATTMGKALSLTYRRVQFTPDVLPSDILGFSMYNSNTGEFEYREGSVFANLFLADELNRTSPKTQSALLEVMEEGTATVDGVTRPLPKPFVVIATENPMGSSGTQMLPESQLDRFMICVTMGYPSHEAAADILKEETVRKTVDINAVMTADELIEVRKAAEKVFVHDSLYDYMVTLVEETRKNVMFDAGASPRASIALLRISRALAVMDGRDFVTAMDVQKELVNVLSHRVKLSGRAKAEGFDAARAVRELLQSVPAPRM